MFLLERMVEQTGLNTRIATLAGFAAIVALPSVGLMMIFGQTRILFAMGRDGEILRTADGGDSWTESKFGKTLQLNAIDFVNESQGWVVGNRGQIGMTMDGGASWSIQMSDKMFNLNSVAFRDAKTGLAIGDEGTVCSTNDGGNRC